MLDLKILQSEWLKAFWSISQEQHFSQIEDLYRNTANNINFHYRTHSGKIKNSLISKNPIFACFGPFSQFLGAKKVFPKNLACTTWQGFLVPCRNSEKPNDPISRKQPNGQLDGRTDRPYFIGPFQLLLGVQKVQLQ